MQSGLENDVQGIPASVPLESFSSSDVDIITEVVAGSPNDYVELSFQVSHILD